MRKRADAMQIFLLKYSLNELSVEEEFDARSSDQGSCNVTTKVYNYETALT